MTQRRSVALVAACALLLACAPLSMIYKGLFEWFIPAALAVAFITGVGIGARALRAAAPLQILATTGALLLYCSWMFRSGSEFLGVIPTGGTFAEFGRLFGSAGKAIAEQSVPINATDDVVFVAVIGIGVCAIVIDALAVTFRLPSLAGLPLLTLYIVPVAILPDSVPWLLFVPGALGYLWLLMTDNIDRVRHFGRRFTGDGRGVELWEPSPLASAGRWLAALIIPVALIVSAMLPGITTGGLLNTFGGTGPGVGPGGTNTTSKVNPVAALQGALDTSQVQELARVTTTSADPGYMKMYAASTLTEKGFQADLTMSTQSVPAEGSLPMTSSQAEGKRQTATFTSIALSDFAIPLFSEPSRVDAGGDWMYDPQTSMVASASTTTKDMRLTYEYVDFSYAPDDLRTAPSAPVNTTPFLRANTSTPDNATVTELVDTLTAEAETDYDKVMAIQDHFSKENGFEYELRTRDGWSASAIESFLKEKRGFCQQYAGAMAWMVRDAGIPARVAIGLTKGSLIGSNEYRLTNFNFHAWVEVYFHGYGWVAFDPTPSAQVRNSTEFPWAPDIDDENSDGTGENGEDDPAEQPGQEPAPGGPDQGPGSTGSTVAWSAVVAPTTWPYWVAGAAAVVLAALMPAAYRLARRARRMRVAATETPAGVEAAWLELEDLLTDLRAEPKRANTPRATGEWLTEHYELSGLAEAGVRHLVAAVEQSRYADRRPGDLTLPRAVTAVRVGLFNAVSTRTAARAALTPVSVLRRWRRGLSGSNAALTTAAVRARLAVSRTLRRPRRRRAV
ncbi:transglutaminaseTgpA domain-containing protein [Stackebrandtia soli]|uniref:transglutaminase family protein n=1 Tax=Stackebrandtia soli TaxID=1892856 RepID=UPI0039E90968